jgi:hypothetical protein
MSSCKYLGIILRSDFSWVDQVNYTVRKTWKALNFTMRILNKDRLCGLVVRVRGYRSGGPGSIPGTSRKKKISGSGTGCTQPREYKLRSYLIEK